MPCERSTIKLSTVQVPKPMNLADDSPEAFSIKSGQADNKVRSIDNYMLSELVKTQKSHNMLLDSVQEIEKRFTGLEAAIKGLRDSEEDGKLHAEQQVELTLSSNQIKASALMAGGAVAERPISNALHNWYTPISSGTYGTLVGLVLMGVTYKRKSDFLKWMSQGYFIGGFSQMIQDLFTWLSTQPGITNAISQLGGSTST